MGIRKDDWGGDALLLRYANTDVSGILSLEHGLKGRNQWQGYDRHYWQASFWPPRVAAATMAEPIPAGRQP